MTGDAQIVYSFKYAVTPSLAFFRNWNSTAHGKENLEDIKRTCSNINSDVERRWQDIADGVFPDFCVIKENISR
jgi:hypothetical protein